MGHKLGIPLIIIAIGNLLTGIGRKEDILYYVLYVFIFLPIAFVLGKVFKENKTLRNRKIVSYIFLAFSIISIYTTESFVLNSAFLFTYSIFLSVKTKKTYAIYGFIFVVSIMIKMFIYPHNYQTIFVYIAGYAFIFIVYEHYIHPKKTKVKNIPFLTAREKKIVSLLASGYRYREMTDMLGEYLSESRIRGMGLDIRKKLDAKTNEQLIYKISKLNGWE